MKKYIKFDNIIDVNKAITSSWTYSDSINELKNNLCNVFKAQQFYNWEEFKVLVNKLIGYEF